MKDQEFLIWIHERLENYGDSPFVDHMHRLRSVISSIPVDQETPNDGRGGNDLDDLKERISLRPERNYKTLYKGLASHHNQHCTCSAIY